MKLIRSDLDFIFARYERTEPSARNRQRNCGSIAVVFDRERSCLDLSNGVRAYAIVERCSGGWRCFEGWSGFSDECVEGTSRQEGRDL